jgi:hypothetical protein
MKKTIPLGEQLKYPTQRAKIMSVIRSDKIPTGAKQDAARRYAEKRGISYKSALRTVDRYTTTKAAQKRGTTRPNPDIVQAIIDGYDKYLTESGELYERVVDPPNDEKVHTWTQIWEFDDFASAIRAADDLADNYRGGSGSDPHLAMVIARGSGILKSENFLTSEGDDLYYLSPNLSQYEMAAIQWIIRR